MECRGRSARHIMNRTERRLRALEESYSVKPRRPVRCVVVDPGKGETLEEVLAREGIGPEFNLIVRTIVDPKPRADQDIAPCFQQEGRKLHNGVKSMAYAAGGLSSEDSG